MPRHVVLALLCACASFKASAQTWSPMAEWQYSAGHVLEPFFQSPPVHERTLGLPVALTPRYEGSNNTRIRTGLVAEVRYRDVAFGSTSEGIGVNLLHGKGYRAGVAATYDVGRPEHTDPALAGLGDLRPAAEAKAFAEYVVLFPVVTRLDVRRTFGGHSGWTADLSAYMPVVGSERFFVMVGPSLTWIDQDNMRHSFGVDTGQSARSGYPAYDPGSGLSAARLGLIATWFVTRRWFLDLSGAEEWLQRKAADSPFVRERRQQAAAVTLGYEW
jgi:outer membrane scaffolding protein for murein synthesis (MipA/OmpV family)